MDFELFDFELFVNFSLLILYFLLLERYSFCSNLKQFVIKLLHLYLDFQLFFFDILLLVWLDFLGKVYVFFLLQFLVGYHLYSRYLFCKHFASQLLHFLLLVYYKLQHQNFDFLYFQRFDLLEFFVHQSYYWLLVLLD